MFESRRRHQASRRDSEVKPARCSPKGEAWAGRRALRPASRPALCFYFFPFSAARRSRSAASSFSISRSSAARSAFSFRAVSRLARACSCVRSRAALAAAALCLAERRGALGNSASALNGPRVPKGAAQHHAGLCHRGFDGAGIVRDRCEALLEFVWRSTPGGECGLLRRCGHDGVVETDVIAEDLEARHLYRCFARAFRNASTARSIGSSPPLPRRG